MHCIWQLEQDKFVHDKFVVWTSCPICAKMCHTKNLLCATRKYFIMKLFLLKYFVCILVSSFLVSNATWEKFWPNCELWWRDEVDLLLALFSCKFPLESASVPCSFSGRAAEKLRLCLRTGTNVIKHPLLIDICLDLTHLLAWWPIKNVFIISCKKNHSGNSSKLENCHFFVSKGQLISKCLFGIFSSPKNEQKNSPLLLWYLKSNCFRSFFGRIEDTKKTFRN